MQNVIDDGDELYSCESFASSSSIDKENRFVSEIVEEFSAFNRTKKSDQTVLELDGENASTSGTNDRRMCIDIDERSLNNGSQMDYDIEAESMGQAIVCEFDELSQKDSRGHINAIENGYKSREHSQKSPQNCQERHLLHRADACKFDELSQNIPRGHFKDRADECDFDEQSQKSPVERGNYVLPVLSNDCLPFPEPSTSRMVDAKSKRRKLGPLSSELLKRIRAQKSMKTLAKFRAYLTEERQTEEESAEEFPDGNVVASAWGVDMIGSTKEVDRFIFRKTVDK